MVLVLVVPFLVIVMAAWVWLAVTETLKANGIEQLEWSSRVKVAADTMSLSIGWQWTGRRCHA